MMLTKNELEWPVHTQEHSHLRCEYHAQSGSNFDNQLPHDVPIHHVHNFEPPSVMHPDTCDKQRSYPYAIQRI